MGAKEAVSGEWGSENTPMDDRIDVYTVVGCMMIFLLLMSGSYGISPLGVFSSVIGLFVGGASAGLLPGILLLLIIGSFAVSSNFNIRDLAAVAVVILFIILVVPI